MSRAEATRLIRELEDQGFQASLARSGHWHIRKNGEYVAVLAASPSEYRGRLNALSRLKRAGFIPPNTKRRST